MGEILPHSLGNSATAAPEKSKTCEHEDCEVDASLILPGDEPETDKQYCAPHYEEHQAGVSTAS